MVGITPPYLYTVASQQDSVPSYDFDPKAVTRASYYSLASATTSSPRPKQVGPLMDFNKHPDSYMIVPSARPNVQPMHPNTKQRIIGARWTQFVLRLLQMLCAVGALICVIIVRGVDDVQGWILRIPPAVDAIVCAYALYNLRRPANSRPASSSSTYNAFSFFVDLAMLPLYVFIAFFSATNWTMAPGQQGRWTTFFRSATEDGKVLESAFLIGSVAVVLHMISLPIDSFLFLVFRKIAEYPPDMNPLQDMLSSSINRKHTYKNSDITLSSPSRFSLGRDQLIPDASVRPMSFHQSRTRYSPHTQDSARQSRFDWQRANASQTDILRASQSHERSRSRSRSSRPQRYANQRPHNRDSVHDAMPVRPLSFVTATENPSRHGTPLQHSSDKDQQSQALLSDNWFVLADDENDLSSPRRTPVPELMSDHESDSHIHEPITSQRRFATDEYRELLPQPLRTGPPTPPDHSFDAANFYFDEMPNGSLDLDDYSLRYTHSNSSIGRALSPPAPEVAAISAKSSFYSQEPSDAPSRSGSVRGKHYGMLQQQTVPRGQGRVVSRTGVDIADASVLYLSSDSSYGSRARHVSGKIVEEGMAGPWALRKRQASGV